MDNSSADLLSRSALALDWLEEIMGDPQAKAIAKVRAVRVLKMCLFLLINLAESQQASPDLRAGIIEVLRRHRRRSLGQWRSRPHLCVGAANAGNQ